MTHIDDPLVRQTVETIKREKNPLIIFGAAVVGEVLFQACVEAGIKVECFCDNNINKTKSYFCNTQVLHTPDVKAKYKDAQFIISAADIKDVIDQLHGLGYSKWHAGSLLLRDFNISGRQFSAPHDFVEYAVTTCLLCHDSFLLPDKLFIRSADLIITERCSLRCRDCSNLMQYYSRPDDRDINDLLKAIDMFCRIIDDINEFRVIGGEPFMHKEFHLVVKRLIDEPKVRRIVIYTNGTIVPSANQIRCLRSSKVLVFITDYGALSRKKDDLTRALQENHAPFYVREAQYWTDCAKISRHNRSAREQKDLFRCCCAKNLITISGEKMYRCPFSANADRLRAIPDFTGDYINFVQELQIHTDIGAIRKKIRDFLLKKEFLRACDYCNGRSFEDCQIRPAVQINRPLEYKPDESR